MDTLAIIEDNQQRFIQLCILAGCTFQIEGNAIFAIAPDLSPPACPGCGYQFAIGDGEAPEDSGLCYECDQACQHCDDGVITIDATVYSACTIEPAYYDIPCPNCKGKG